MINSSSVSLCARSFSFIFSSDELRGSSGFFGGTVGSAVGVGLFVGIGLSVGVGSTVGLSVGVGLFVGVGVGLFTGSAVMEIDPVGALSALPARSLHAVISTAQATASSQKHMFFFMLMHLLNLNYRLP